MKPERQVLLARALVFALVALACLWRVGSTPLLETDEGFAANRAASFQRHHTWRLSYDDVNDDNPQFRKPPLLYWAVASLYPLIGHNTWAVRLPGALASVGLCWLLFRITRRHFDEPVALGAVVLFATVPFALHHMRTAMLEMPLMALTFAAIYALAYLPGRRGSAVLAGLAAGGAVLIKGSPGFLAITVAAIHCLALGRFSAKSWRRAGIALAVTGLIFAIYAFKIVPHRWQHTMLEAMFVKEGARRTVAATFTGHLGSVLAVLWTDARFIIALAAPGLLLALACAFAPARAAWRRPEIRSWLLLLLLVCVPVFIVGVEQVRPFPRYFLPLYPFLATLTALVLWRAARRAALYVPLLLLAAALSTMPAWDGWPCPQAIERPYPGMKELASQIPAYVPAGEKLILATPKAPKLKCHQLLFYGRRAIETDQAWLACGPKPGTTRHVLEIAGSFKPPPGITTEVLATSGPFRLLALHVPAAAPLQTKEGGPSAAL